MLHRFKWDVAVQRDGDEALSSRLARRRSGFVGLIDKAEWSLPVGLGFFEPRWKSELRFDRPYLTRREKAASLEETVFPDLVAAAAGRADAGLVPRPLRPADLRHPAAARPRAVEAVDA